MKQEIFRGIATALATPMELDGAIDYEAYGRLIDWQIDAGVAGLVACGTTGESATMTEAEHKEVIRFTVERAAGRVPVIAGTGSNCTAKAVAMTAIRLLRGRRRLSFGNPLLQQGHPGRPHCPLHRHCRRLGQAPHPLQCPLPHRLQPAAGHLCRSGRSSPNCRRKGGLGQHRPDCGGGRPGRRPARHLFRQRRPYCACPLHGRLRLHLRAVQRSSPGGARPFAAGSSPGMWQGLPPCSASFCLW